MTIIKFDEEEQRFLDWLTANLRIHNDVNIRAIVNNLHRVRQEITDEELFKIKDEDEALIRIYGSKNLYFNFSPTKRKALRRCIREFLAYKQCQKVDKIYNV